MEKAVIGWPRWTDRATFAGGSWAAEYPVTGLGSLPLARVARSTNLLPASTKLSATLDKERMIRALAIVRHNLSLYGKYRVRLWADAAKTQGVYDSGWRQVWQAVYPSESLEWEADNWWSGTPTEEELAGLSWTTPVWLGAIYLARVVELELDDQINPAGYVELGMLEIAQGWQVSVNPDYGAEEGFRFRSAEVEALGGGKYFDRRDKPRVFRGRISYLPRDEAIATGFDHMRQADTVEPFLWFPDPEEVQHHLRTVFLARNVSPGLIAHAAPGRGSLPLSFEEVL